MIAWKGFGFLIVIIGIGTLMATQLIVDAVFGKGYYTNHSDTYAALGLIMAAAITYLTYDRWLKLRETPRRLRDEATGQLVLHHSRSSLFFVPFQYWPIIFLGLAAVAYFVKSS